MKYITTIDSKQYVIEIDQGDQVTVNGQIYHLDLQQLPESGLLSLLLNNHSFEAAVEERGESWQVLLRGELYTVVVEDERMYELRRVQRQSGAFVGVANIKSPMPGIIVKMPVEEGDNVKKGQTVAILESMKMENELKTPRDGIVKRVSVQKGQSVEKDQLLLVITDGEKEKETG